MIRASTVAAVFVLSAGVVAVPAARGEDIGHTMVQARTTEKPSGAAAQVRGGVAALPGRPDISQPDSPRSSRVVSLDDEEGPFNKDYGDSGGGPGGCTIDHCETFCTPNPWCTCTYYCPSGQTVVEKPGYCPNTYTSCWR